MTKKPADLFKQFDPMYGYDENGRWNGMTPAEVEVWLAEMREESRRRTMLRHWDHRSSSVN